VHRRLRLVTGGQRSEWQSVQECALSSNANTRYDEGAWNKGHKNSEVSEAVTMKNAIFWSVMRAAVARTDHSEERIASIIRGERISELLVANYC
jgi:hypothetical protein